MDLQDEMLSSAELARRLRVSRRTIFRLLASGRLPEPTRLSARTLRWRWQAVRDFLDRSGKRQKSRGGDRG